MAEAPEQTEVECDESIPSSRLCHSCAHVLGAALMELFPCTSLAFGLPLLFLFLHIFTSNLTGPALKDNQFFYEGEILDKKRRFDSRFLVVCFTHNSQSSDH